MTEAVQSSSLDLVPTASSESEAVATTQSDPNHDVGDAVTLPADVEDDVGDSRVPVSDSADRTRVVVSKEELEKASTDRIVELWSQQEKYIRQVRDH